jgi:hypothetical protein
MQNADIILDCITLWEYSFCISILPFHIKYSIVPSINTSNIIGMIGINLRELSFSTMYNRMYAIIAMARESEFNNLIYFEEFNRVGVLSTTIKLTINVKTKATVNAMKNVPSSK